MQRRSKIMTSEDAEREGLVLDKPTGRLLRRQPTQAEQMMRARIQTSVHAKTKRGRGWIIDPRTNHVIAYWDLVATLALVFTAIVTPYEIGFLHNYKSPSLDLLNNAVLVVFAIGLVCTFFVPYREAAWKGGALVRDHRKIVCDVNRGYSPRPHRFLDRREHFDLCGHIKRSRRLIEDNETGVTTHGHCSHGALQLTP